MGAMKWCAAVVLLLTPFIPQARATTYTAASCAESDVANAVRRASNGDTVVIPSCPGGVAWTANLTVTKAINLLGSGQGVTVLIDNVSKMPCGAGQPLITLSIAEDRKWRVANFTIQSGETTDQGRCSSHLRVEGGSHSFRVDHITFDNMQSVGIHTGGDLWGVVDHCTFNGAHRSAIKVWHDSWAGVGRFGNNSWAQPDTLGTNQAVFFEDNTCNITHAAGAGCFEAEVGGRITARHNRVQFSASHGIEIGGNGRSIRQFEVYDNTYSNIVNGVAYPNINTAFLDRGGTGVFFNNNATTSTDGVYVTLLLLANYRDMDTHRLWGGCNGTSPYDNNDRTTYDKGTFNGLDGTSDVLTDSTKTWTPSQWANGDYTLLNITAGWGTVIRGNDRNTITSVRSNNGQNRQWRTGDSYQIRRSYPCIDQVGRGAGDLLSGPPPNPAAWPHQAQRPVYSWNNSKNGIAISGARNQQPHMQPNRDYYDWNSSFDGTSGVGVGLLAARPPTCSPLVAYWATDSKTLYQCSSKNTWTVYYKPYTYPHPLTRTAEE